MTIEEAVRAARKCQPVVYDSPMSGPQLYARIGCVRKDFATPDEVRRGRASEAYFLELLPMNAARSVTVVPADLVHVAAAEEIAEYRQYFGAPPMPEVHPELICEEVKSGRPWGERKG